MTDYVQSVDQADDEGRYFDLICQSGDVYTAWYHPGDRAWYFDYPGEHEASFDSLDDIIAWLNADDA